MFGKAAQHESFLQTIQHLHLTDKVIDIIFSIARSKQNDIILVSIGADGQRHRFCRLPKLMCHSLLPDYAYRQVVLLNKKSN